MRVTDIIPAAKDSARPRGTKQLLHFLRDVAAEFHRHGCASLAASLAFFSLLSLFPLVFLLLYASGAWSARR